MHLSKERRRQLRRANTLAKGHILAARCAETKEDLSEALCKALLTYGIWASDAV
jgi:hypothetical protein